MIQRIFLTTAVGLSLVASNLCADIYSGVVVDRETYEPLSGVSVTLFYADDSAETTTDDSGHFTLNTTIGILYNTGVFSGRNLIRWHAAKNCFDFRSAPDIKRAALFTVRGACISSIDCMHQSSLFPLPRLSWGVYFLFLKTQNGEHAVRWLYCGQNSTFHCNGNVNRTASSAKRDLPLAEMVFQKEHYQTKSRTIESDSIYDSMFVTLCHVIGEYIFNQDTVRTYRFYLSDEAMNALFDYASLVPTPYVVNAQYVPARLEFEDRVLDSVAIRFRGDQSLWDCVDAYGNRRTGVFYPQFGFGNGDICAKFSLKCNFKKYIDDQRLYALKRLNFRSMAKDPSNMRERLACSIFHDMNIIAPRAVHAKVYVNDEFWGLFCAVEQIDGRFTEHRFPESGDGNLYKEIWLDIRTTDATILQSLQTNDDPIDTTSIATFRSFKDAVNSAQTDSANFLAEIALYVNVDHLVNYMVVDRGIMNFDGVISCYTFSGMYLRHNYYWYQHEESGHLVLIPWDLDMTFFYPEPNFWTNNEPNGLNILPNWNVVNTDYTPRILYFDPGGTAVSSGMGYQVLPIDADKFLRLLRNTTWNDFCSGARDFLDNVLTEETVIARVDTWHDQIAGIVGEDATIDSTEWESMVDSLKNSIADIRYNLEMMIDTLIVLE